MENDSEGALPGFPESENKGGRGAFRNADRDAVTATLTIKRSADIGGLVACLGEKPEMPSSPPSYPPTGGLL